MKPRLKIQFADMTGYQKKDNLILRTLRERYEVEISDQPDILFYNVYGTGYEHYKYKNCIKVFLGSEATFPNFYECDYAFGRFDIQFGDRYCRLLDLKYYDTLTDRTPFISQEIGQKRFCNFIYHNTTIGDGAEIRQRFCKRLMKYKKVDCPGKALNNMQTDELTQRHAKDWGDGKRSFIGKYKFTIAFENQGIEGYTTEKMVDPLAAGSVPIYWGNRRASDLFNEGAYINAMDGDFDEVIERVIYLDQNEGAYREALTTVSIKDPALFQTDWEQKKREFILFIAENGSRITNQDRMVHDYGTPVLRKYTPPANPGYMGLSFGQKIKHKINHVIGR